MAHITGQPSIIEFDADDPCGAKDYTGLSDFEWIRDSYKVPAEHGRVVIMDGKRRGVIVEDQGNYIGVLFDDRKPGQIETCHPTYALTYTEELAAPRKMTKSQARYRKYLEVADLFNSFKDFLRSPSARI